MVSNEEISEKLKMKKELDEQAKQNPNEDNLSLEDKQNKWIKQIVTYTAIWGVLNLLIASPIFGGILIFFAILIYASKSFMAIYAFGVVWLLLALFQLILGAYYTGYVSFESQGYLLIIFAFVNFAFGGWAIYKTRKLDIKL